MTTSPLLSYWILAATSATLFWLALTDFKEFRIRNDLVLVIVGLYFAYAFASGRWVAMHWNIGFALLMFLGMLYAYSMQQMGGGDLKLLAAAFLWTGPSCAAPFVLLLLVFVGAHYVAGRFEWVAVKRSAAGMRVPLAPSVAGALIGTFALGCMAPAA